MKILLLVLLLISLTFAGCSASDPDSEFLNGDWTDYVPKKGTQDYAGNKVEIRFMKKLGVFYYHVEQWSDVETGKDTCGFYSNEQYSAGKFNSKGNTLTLNGDWMDSYYRESSEFPCIDSSKVALIYSMNVVSDDELELRLKSPLPYKYDWRIREKMTLVRITKEK